MNNRQRMISFLLLLCFYQAAAAQQLTIQERLARLERNSGNAQGIAELVTQVQQLQQEVAELRGQLERQAFELESLKKRQKVLYVDLDSRVQALEKSAPQTPRDNAETTAEKHNTPALVTSHETAETTKPEVQPSTATQASSTGTDNDTQAAVLYEEAFAHLKAGRYTDSARLFEDFIQQHPNHELTDNAYYWLGESYYVTRNYELALDAFEQLKSRFPNSHKLADALLKIGYTQYELGLYPQAWETLQTVVREFPSSAVARLAQTRLRKMQREGKTG